MLSPILYIANLVIVAFDITICCMGIGFFIFFGTIDVQIIYSPIMKTY
jgi:hypothetical protein